MAPINLGHDLFIVTSQYSMVEIFAKWSEPRDLVALKRRFEIINFTKSMRELEVEPESKSKNSKRNK
jgi:hypothetical protein